MLKKVCSYIFILFILISFAGCSGSDEEHISTGEFSIQQSNDIMAALQSDDTETFKSYLCPKIHDTHPDLDDEIREFFDFIDGDIISYHAWAAAAGGHTTPKGWDEKFFSADVENIETSSGTTYNIQYYYNLIYEDHPELLGIKEICITTSDAEYDQQTGYPPGKYRIIIIKD